MTDTRNTDRDEAARELRPAGVPPASITDVLTGDVWDQWVAQVRDNPAYHLRDPDNPDADDSLASTNSSGSNPPPPIIVEYGDGPNDYVVTWFDAGQVIIQDGNDATGRAWKFPESAWRRFVARVRGEELPEDEREKGDSMYEGARKLAARTAEQVQADRSATEAARGGTRTQTVRRGGGQGGRDT